MKLNEVEFPPFYVPTDKQKRIARLKHMIDNGLKPDVYDAGFILGKFTFGDLEELGYAEREHYDRSADDFYWFYTGPKPIELVSRKFKRLPDGRAEQWEDRHEMRHGDRTDQWFGQNNK